MMRIPRTGRMTARATVEEEILPGEGAKTETTNGHPKETSNSFSHATDLASDGRWLKHIPTSWLEIDF